MGYDYSGEERRSASLSDAQLDAIAERAAEKALAKVYEEIGRSIVKKALWVIGAGTLALFAYMKGSGKL